MNLIFSDEEICKISKKKVYRNGIVDEEENKLIEAAEKNRTNTACCSLSLKEPAISNKNQNQFIFDDLISRLERCRTLAIEARIKNGNFRSKSNEEVQRNKQASIRIVQYSDESQMPDIVRLITKDLSEPYSIYTYRYFIHNWPDLCILAYDSVKTTYIGAIVCKLDFNRNNKRRGYIAMLAIDEAYRRLKIGSCLVQKAIENMQNDGCNEVVLETEVTNENALRLYENLGFIREKRLFRYYLNGVDAFRLKLFLALPS